MLQLAIPLREQRHSVWRTDDGRKPSLSARAKEPPFPCHTHETPPWLEHVFAFPYNGRSIDEVQNDNAQSLDRDHYAALISLHRVRPAGARAAAYGSGASRRTCGHGRRAKRRPRLSGDPSGQAGHLPTLGARSDQSRPERRLGRRLQRRHDQGRERNLVRHCRAAGGRALGLYLRGRWRSDARPAQLQHQARRRQHRQYPADPRPGILSL